MERDNQGHANAVQPLGWAGKKKKKRFRATAVIIHVAYMATLRVQRWGDFQNQEVCVHVGDLLWQSEHWEILFPALLDWTEHTCNATSCSKNHGRTHEVKSAVSPENITDLCDIFTVLLCSNRYVRHLHFSFYHLFHWLCAFGIMPGGISTPVCSHQTVTLTSDLLSRLVKWRPSNQSYQLVLDGHAMWEGAWIKRWNEVD